MLRRIHFHITGRVQHVGLRRRAARYAPDCMVTGWIKNEPDYSVELEVQGEDWRIEDFLERLQGAAWFDTIDRKTLPVIDETSFEIRR